MQSLALISICFVGFAAQAQMQQIHTCSILASRGQSSSAAQCNSEVAGKYLSSEADSVCSVLAEAGYSSSVVQCIKGAVGANHDINGLAVCKELASRGQSSSVGECMSTLRNKLIDQRIIGSCLQLARDGYSSSVVTCVKNTVIGDMGSVPYPGNPNYPGNGNDRQDAIILNLIARTKEAILSRNTQSALRLLDRMEQTIQQRRP